MKTSPENKEQLTFDTSKMEWEEIFDDKIGKSLFDKKLIDDYDTGMVVNFSRYPAGYYKEFHRHACSHGIYVLSGTLKTDKGEYGPGCFVWHPEGVVARHGATDKEDCCALFITNKPFEISYPDK